MSVDRSATSIGPENQKSGIRTEKPLDGTNQDRTLVFEVDGKEYPLLYKSRIDPKEGIPATQVVRAILTYYKLKEGK